MENLFLTVLSMSGAASLAILIVLLARLFLRRTPKVFSYALWAVVLFRLLCPVTIESVFSLMPAVRTVPAGDGQSAVQIQPPIPALNVPMGAVNDYLYTHPYPANAVPAQIHKDSSGLPASESAGLNWRSVSGLVWITGTAALLGYSVLSLLRLRYRLIGAVPLAGKRGVLLADHIPTPFVLGLFRPWIYLPSDLPEAERDYILLHERTHIRRGDHLFRALAWLAVSLHWFNPLVWLAFRLAGKDMEMSCDEAVIRRMGQDIRADYSASLLRLSAGGKLPTGPLTFGDSDPKRRIKNVLSYKKPALRVVVIGLVGVLALGAALATNTGRSTNAPAEPMASVGKPASATQWLDYYDAAGLSWEERAELELLEYPGVTFRWTPGEVKAVRENGETVLFTGMPIWNVYLCDLTGDGKRELCATVSVGSGLIDDRILVYDCETGTLYEWQDRGVHDYRLCVDGGCLMAEVRSYQADEVLSYGPLVLTNGALGISSERQIPLYRMSEFDSVLVGGFIGPYLEWSADASPSGGMLCFADDISFCCPRLAGRTVEGSAVWTDEERTAVSVTMTIGDERAEGGTIDGFYCHFRVDLTSGTVIEQTFESEIEGETLWLDTSEMLGIGVAMGDLLTGAEDFYQLHRDETEYAPAPVLELDPVYTLDELGVSVAVTGLDCDSARWYSRALRPELAENVRGYLDIWEPRFLGEAFSENYQGVTAAYLGSELILYLSGRGDIGNETCTVNIINGSILAADTELWAEPAGVSPKEMLSAARALAELIQGASDYYIQATDVPPEEGPLPFDKPMKLWFGSGAGGWNTILTLHPDGSFEGNYHDSEDAGQFQYVCQFHGTFQDITQATSASWSLTLGELVLDTGHPIGEEWTEDGIRYAASSPYGFDDNNGDALTPGAQFIFYTPEAAGHAPGTELYGLEGTADFWGWWPERHSFERASDTLGCYGLRNMETGYGFFDLHAWGLM